MPKNRPARVFNTPAPRAVPRVPALVVVFTAPSYPAFRLNEGEDDMIIRTAAKVLGVAAAAVLPVPTPQYLGQGHGTACLFEVRLRPGSISATALNANPAVINVTREGHKPALTPPPRNDKLRLPRNK